MASASVLEKLKSLAAELAGEVQSASLPLRGLAVGAVPHPEPGMARQLQLQQTVLKP